MEMMEILMENPDQPVWDPRYEDSGPPHTDETCEDLVNSICSHINHFDPMSSTYQRIIEQRLYEFYQDNPDEFYEDYKEIHG